MIISVAAAPVSVQLETNTFKVPLSDGVISMRPQIGLADLISDASIEFGLLMFDPVRQKWDHVASGVWKGPSDPLNPDTIPMLWVLAADVVKRDAEVKVYLRPSRTLVVGLEVTTEKAQPLDGAQ